MKIIILPYPWLIFLLIAFPNVLSAPSYAMLPTMDEVKLLDKKLLCKSLIVDIVIRQAKPAEVQKQDGRVVILRSSEVSDLIQKVREMAKRKIFSENGETCAFQNMGKFALNTADIRLLLTPTMTASSSRSSTVLAPNSNSNNSVDKIGKLLDQSKLFHSAGGFKSNLLGAFFAKMLLGLAIRLESVWSTSRIDELETLMRAYRCFKFRPEIEGESFANFGIERMQSDVKFSENNASDRYQIQYENFAFINELFTDRPYKISQMIKLINVLINDYMEEDERSSSMPRQKGFHSMPPAVTQLGIGLVRKFSLQNEKLKMADKCQLKAFIDGLIGKMLSNSLHNIVNNELNNSRGKLRRIGQRDDYKNCDKLNETGNEELKNEMWYREAFLHFENWIKIEKNEKSGLFDVLAHCFEQFMQLDPSDLAFDKARRDLTATVPRDYRYPLDWSGQVDYYQDSIDRVSGNIVDKVKFVVNNRHFYAEIKQIGQELCEIPESAGSINADHADRDLAALIDQLDTKWGPMVKRLNERVSEVQTLFSKWHTSEEDKEHEMALKRLALLGAEASTLLGQDVLQELQMKLKQVQADDGPPVGCLGPIGFRWAIFRLEFKCRWLVVMLRAELGPAARALPAQFPAITRFNERIKDVLKRLAEID